MTTSFPTQRWQFPTSDPAQVAQLSNALGVSPLMAQILLNRGVTSLAEAEIFLNPEQQLLPSPLAEFADLATSLDILADAIATQQQIRICGDYDADGMTSTALLIRALRHLGAKVDYAIPSRMQEGYGINERMVDDCVQDQVSVILTVDNGIAAPVPIAKARDLGIAVIVTDHHDLPDQLPPAHAILNPKLLPTTSPYWGLAGVGVSYVLAISLAQKLGRLQGLSNILLALFTLGTIADLAPLVGVNRRWVKRGLQILPQSQLTGMQALIQVANLQTAAKTLKPEAIGFRLGPRINAVGRIADPQIVIDLLTTDDPEVAQTRAQECEAINQQRQALCAQIEEAAIAYLETTNLTWHADRVLVLVQPDWHHGVIGIVASRLVERYGVPVFIGTYEENGTQIRGSARSIPEFHVFEALNFCQDLLDKFGGHQAAGGFSLSTDQLDSFRQRLRTFAHQHLQPEHLKPLINVDAQADLIQLTPTFFQDLEQLQPCGMENANPIFATSHVDIVEQRLMGKQQAHVRLSLQHTHPHTGVTTQFQAIGWRWGTYYPLPTHLDIAYRLTENHWNGETTLQLELVGMQPSTDNAQDSLDPAPQFAIANPPNSDPPKPKKSRRERQRAVDPQRFLKTVTFQFKERPYQCQMFLAATGNTLQIQNPEGQVLVVQPERQEGYLSNRTPQGEVQVQPVDITLPFYTDLIEVALQQFS